MKKYFSILLSFILLASHINLTIGTHFCGGEAIETKVILGQMHLGCDMPDMDESFNDFEKYNNHDFSFNNVPCCENKYQTVQVTDEYLKDKAPLSFNVDFAVAFIYKTLNLDLFSRSTHKFYTNYAPPPLEKDIQILFQTFLI